MLKTKVIALLKKDPQITAFFVTEYYPATILYQVLIELNYKIPNDFSIICYDSPHFYNESVVHFTHVQQNEKQIAEDSFKMLDALINKKNESIQKLENADLIIGDTTAIPRN
ncbi:substrate-binding domain-containing protein [Pediococcus damnosus]|uniref:substrate-binding domain-containing protein n=1 Tax=Pediococcus damnosus TaxID=51663 RepID=UPI003B969916